MLASRIKRLLIGEPLTEQLSDVNRLPKWRALPSLSSDALSSVAYGTEAILAALVAFAAAAAVWSIPIALGIIGLLIILTASYWQTIAAYPIGGGAYVVAKENLGQKAGLVAGAALLLDYILTVSVSVSAGIENLASAYPWLLEHKEGAGVAVITVITLMNLRGMRDSALAFVLPTYFFIFSVLALLVAGAWKVAIGEVPEAAPVLHEIYPVVPMILILRAFASGCVALTGIESISNGVSELRQPSEKNARIVLVWMAAILGGLFLGVTCLVHALRILPGEGQTVISQLGRIVFSDSWLYYVVQFATAAILFQAANTSYGEFPRIASLLARDRFLPRQLASVGDRLVYSNGIVGLGLGSALLIYAFDGKTLSLIPLYAIGVFISFTLSQAGMVMFHYRSDKPGRGWRLFFNAIGATTTLIVLADLSIAKFSAGAWMVLLAIPLLIALFVKIHRHYLAVGKELSLVTETPPFRFEQVRHSVIIPVSGIHRGVREAVRYALTISDDVRACYVELDPAAAERVAGEWKRWFPDVPFVVLKSPNRSVARPLIKYIEDVEQITHEDMITVVVPEFVTTQWWHRVLHNQTALFIRAALIFKPRKVVTSVRYHLKDT